MVIGITFQEANVTINDFSLTTNNVLLVMAVLVFVLGVITCLTGILILSRRATGKEVKTLTAQTTALAQKGLAEDVAGLVGNATSLMNAMNQLVLTTAGVGVFLTILGLLMIGIACWLTLQINFIQP